MSRRRLSQKKKEDVKRIAKERINVLTRNALDAFRKGRMDLAQRYSSLARKIQLRYRIRLKKEIALKYCKKCYTPWIAGSTLKVRTNSSIRCIEYICKKCGYIRRYRY